MQLTMFKCLIIHLSQHVVVRIVVKIFFFACGTHYHTIGILVMDMPHDHSCKPSYCGRGSEIPLWFV